MKNTILTHKKGFTIFTCIFLVFMGCFSFPIFNFSKEAPNISKWLNILTAFLAYYELGLLQGILYHSKVMLKCTFTTFSMTVLGFLCRFLLEYGEISNTYNFTMPNILFHLLISICIVTFGVFYSPQNN